MQLKISTKQFWTGQWLLLLTFLLLHTIASYYYIAHQNITFDEPQYIEYAKHWLKGKPERVEILDDSKSPIVAICWIPRIVRQVINPNYKLYDYGRKDQQEGRYMMIVFSFLTALYVYWWCKDLYGRRGWVMPLLLLLFDPLYLAYSTIITTDLACGTFLIASLYHYRRYLVLRSRKDFYLAAVATMLAIVTKQNMLYLPFILLLLSIIHFFFTAKGERGYIKKALADGFVFLLIIIVGINVAYYFHRTCIPFDNYTFESNTLRKLQHSLTFLHNVPVPLPYSYVQSVDMIKAHSEGGAEAVNSTLNGVYLFGELKLKGGFWYYYIVLLFYKMPIGTMLLFASSLILFFKEFSLRGFSRKYMFLLVPIFFYFIALSFFNQFQIGIRHILLLYPLLYTGLGFLFHYLAGAQLKYKLLTAIAVVYTFVSVAFYYPYIIPYTNEFVTDKKTVYKKIADSSIDYGQADSSVAGFIAEHPGYKKSSPVPDTGRFAIVMSNVVNTNLRDKNPYKWYQKFEPEDVYRYVVLLYNIKEEDLIKAGFKK